MENIIGLTTEVKPMRIEFDRRIRESEEGRCFYIILPPTPILKNKLKEKIVHFSIEW